MRKIVGLAIIVALTGLLMADNIYADSFTDPSFVDGMRSSILILPPINNTKRNEAVFKTYAFLTAEVGKKGYFVYAPEIIEQRLEELNLKSFTDVNHIPFEKLEQAFGADAIMVITILDWGVRDYMAVGQEAVIELKVEVYDSQSQKLLFQNQARLRKETAKTFLVIDDFKDSTLDDLIALESAKFVKPMPQGKHFYQWGY